MSGFENPDFRVLMSYLLLLSCIFSIRMPLSMGQYNNKAIIPLKKDTLKTIIVDNYYPYAYGNKDGEPDGFSIDLAKAVTHVMGMELKITIDTWEHAKAVLEDMNIDLLPMMAYSKEKDKVFDFSVPHTVAYDALFTEAVI